MYPNMFIQAIWGLVRGNQGDLLRLHIWPTAESCALPVLKNRRHGLIEYMLQISNRYILLPIEGIYHRIVIQLETYWFISALLKLTMCTTSLEELVYVTNNM